MRYIGEPNLTVIDYENNKKVFQFDDNGEFITDNEKLIKWMKENKGFIKYENNAIESDKPMCKKCGLEFENKGLLLAHYREHKKEG
jgi:ribosome biogenesis GTPase A